MSLTVDYPSAKTIGNPISTQHLPLDDQPDFGVDGISNTQRDAIEFFLETFVRRLHQDPSLRQTVEQRLKQLDDLQKFNR